jgi:Dolichyl-phosphate-mannose-protein mannosyltransferase
MGPWRLTGRLGRWGADPRADYWILAAIVLLGLLIRLRTTGTWNLEHPDSVARLHGDESQYDSHALQILNGQDYDPPDRVPLYPLFLAAAHWLTRDSYSGILYVQALLGLTVIPLTYVLGRRLLGRRPALIAALFAAVSYVLVHQSLSYLSEVLYTPVILMVAISLVDAIRQPTRGRLAWAGVWLGISWLVRPTLLLFPVAALLLFRATLGRPAVLGRWLIYVLTATLVATPWLVRNTVRYHAVFPLATSNAFLYLASPEYYHLVRDRHWPYLRVWRDVIYGPDSRKHYLLTVDGDRWWTRRGIRSILREPDVYLRYAGERLADYWIGDPNVDWLDTHPFDYQRLRDVGYGRKEAIEIMLSRGLPIVALFAIFVLWRHRRVLLPIYAILAYCTILHAAFHAEARLSDPLQPLLLILIAGALTIRRGDLPAGVGQEGVQLRAAPN